MEQAAPVADLVGAWMVPNVLQAVEGGTAGYCENPGYHAALGRIDLQKGIECNLNTCLNARC